MDSVSKYGSILHIINNGTVQFTNPTLMYGKARQSGGAFYAEGTGTVNLDLIDCSGIMNFFESNLDGGFVATDNKDLILNLNNCSMTNIYAGRNGGFL